MLSHNKDICALVRTLIESTCTYTASHIGNEKNRFAYVKAMSRCLSTCSEKANRNDISRMKKELLKIKVDSIKNLRWRFEIVSRTNQYYKLGIGQALDVIESIDRRFEKGYSYADEYFVRSILGDRKNED